MQTYSQLNTKNITIKSMLLQLVTFSELIFKTTFFHCPFHILFVLSKLLSQSWVLPGWMTLGLSCLDWFLIVFN